MDLDATDFPLVPLFKRSSMANVTGCQHLMQLTARASFRPILPLVVRRPVAIPDAASRGATITWPPETFFKLVFSQFTARSVMVQVARMVVRHGWLLR